MRNLILVVSILFAGAFAQADCWYESVTVCDDGNGNCHGETIQICSDDSNSGNDGQQSCGSPTEVCSTEYDPQQGKHIIVCRMTCN